MDSPSPPHVPPRRERLDGVVGESAVLLPSSQLYSDSVGSQPAESRMEPLLPRELGSRPTGLLAMAAAWACVRASLGKDRDRRGEVSTVPKRAVAGRSALQAGTCSTSAGSALVTIDVAAVDRLCRPLSASTTLRTLLGWRARAFQTGLAAPSFSHPNRCPAWAAAYRLSV